MIKVTTKAITRDGGLRTYQFDTSETLKLIKATDSIDLFTDAVKDFSSTDWYRINAEDGTLLTQYNNIAFTKFTFDGKNIIINFRQKSDTELENETLTGTIEEKDTEIARLQALLTENDISYDEEESE